MDFRLVTSPITVSLSLPVQSMSSTSEKWWHLLRDEGKTFRPRRRRIGWEWGGM